MGKTTKILMFMISCFLMGCGETQKTETEKKEEAPSEESIQETVEYVLRSNPDYICPAKNLGRAHKRYIEIEQWKGVFKESDTEYIGKIDITYNDCWKKFKRTTMSFLFRRTTKGVWVLDRASFDSANQFVLAPPALTDWHHQLTKEQIVLGQITNNQKLK